MAPILTSTDLLFLDILDACDGIGVENASSMGTLGSTDDRLCRYGAQTENASKMALWDLQMTDYADITQTEMMT